MHEDTLHFHPPPLSNGKRFLFSKKNALKIKLNLENQIYPFTIYTINLLRYENNS